MHGRMLVVHASKYGSTREVAETVADVLREQGEPLAVAPVTEVGSLDGFDAVVLGSGLYMGRLHRDARRFLRRYRHELEVLPLAVFALGPFHDSGKELEGSRRQLEQGLSKLHVKPEATAVFGGVLDPEQMPFPFSRMEPSDARDWDEIRDWAAALVRTPVPV